VPSRARLAKFHSVAQQTSPNMSTPPSAAIVVSGPGTQLAIEPSFAGERQSAVPPVARAYVVVNGAPPSPVMSDVSPEVASLQAQMMQQQVGSRSEPTHAPCR
jgi:hypothetical protein